MAIATALMPPLCTAGYGLAIGNLSYFLGAFYLFAINCVFIAMATLMMVRVMRLPSLSVLETRSLFKRRTLVGLVVLLTLVPSVFLAMNLVQREWFDSYAARFVHDVLSSKPNVLVVSQLPDFKARQLRVNLVGDRLSDADIRAIEQRLPEFGLAGVELALVQSGQAMLDMNLVKKELLTEFVQSNRVDIAEREARIAALQDQLQAVQKAAEAQLPLQAIYREVQAQFPQALQLNVSSGLRSDAAKPGDATNSAPERPLLLVQLQLRDAISATEKERLRQGLRTRAGLTDLQDVQLEVSVTAPVRPVAAAKKKR